MWVVCGRTASQSCGAFPLQMCGERQSAILGVDLLPFEAIQKLWASGHLRIHPPFQSLTSLQPHLLLFPLLTFPFPHSIKHFTTLSKVSQLFTFFLFNLCLLAHLFSPVVSGELIHN